MALDIVWTDEANEGLYEIIEHLEKNGQKGKSKLFLFGWKNAWKRSKKPHSDKKTRSEN